MAFKKVPQREYCSKNVNQESHNNPNVVCQIRWYLTLLLQRLFQEKHCLERQNGKKLLAHEENMMIPVLKKVLFC